jgi:hypothetical protein
VRPAFSVASSGSRPTKGIHPPGRVMTPSINSASPGTTDTGSFACSRQRYYTRRRRGCRVRSTVAACSLRGPGPGVSARRPTVPRLHTGSPYVTDGRLWLNPVWCGAWPAVAAVSRRAEGRHRSDSATAVPDSDGANRAGRRRVPPHSGGRRSARSRAAAASDAHRLRTGGAFGLPHLGPPSRYPLAAAAVPILVAVARQARSSSAVMMRKPTRSTTWNCATCPF